MAEQRPEVKEFVSRFKEKARKRQERATERLKPIDTAGTKSALEALKKDKPDIANRQDLENLANLEQPTTSPPDAHINNQPEISTTGQEIIKVDQVNHDASPDKWIDSGSLQINGDYLSFKPESKRRENPYVPGNKDYDNFERYGVDYDPEEFPGLFLDAVKKRVERGFKLAAVPDPELVDPEVAKMTELKKVPDPILWTILEANPNSQDKKYKLTVSVDSLETVRTEVSVYDPDDFQVKVREGDLGYSWKGITVDKETLVNMQHKALEYLEAQVNAGKMPQAVLDAAEGILRYSSSAPEDPHIKKLGTDQKASGGSPENPKVEMKWWKFFATDKWSVKGQLGQADENYLFYQDEKLKHRNRQRRVTIASSDPEDQTGQRLVLTKTAWDILRRVPLPVPGYSDSIGISNERGFTTLSSERAVQDKKKGIWKSETKPLSTDSLTLSQMQRIIRNYVDKQVTNGRIEADVLATVDGILKYKHGTLEPLRHEGDILIYRIKGKEKPPAKRLPVLIDKIVNEASNEEPNMSVDVTPDEVKRYLASKKLPAGASIRNLKFEFNGAQAAMTGFIDVPIPFMGGKIHFNLELANNPDGSGLVVTKHHVETESGKLRSKLGDLETNLKNINGFISDDINEQLRYHDPFLRVLGLLITPDGKFSVKVKNSKQAAA